jgi:hypothetical protein
MEELWWHEEVAAQNMNHRSGVKHFMCQNPGAAVFLLLDDVPPGRGLVEVRFLLLLFIIHSFIQYIQFLQEVLGDAYDSLAAGGGVRGLFILNQHAGECLNVVRG